MSTRKGIDRNKIYYAIHCGLVRQFCGAPYLIAYSIYIFKVMGSVEAGQDALIVSVVQMGGAIIGIFLIYYFQRKYLIIFSNASGILLCILIAITNGMSL